MKKISFLLIILSNVLMFSQTHIPAGNVSGNWTSDNSPYYIDGEIEIPDGENLTIEPGIDVIFTGHYKFNVQGRLLAIGTEADSIHFTVNDTTGFSNPEIPNGGWHGIRFEATPTTNDSSKIVFCKFKYGKAIGENHDHKGGAIYLSDFSKVAILNTKIQYNYAGWGSGIYCTGSKPKLKNLFIIENLKTHVSGYAMVIGDIPWYEQYTLQNIVIFNNQCHGLKIGANIIMLNCKITNNNGNGISYSFCSPIIINTLISNNDGSGIYALNSSAEVINCTITNNNIAGVYLIGLDESYIEEDVKFHKRNRDMDFVNTIIYGNTIQVSTNNTSPSFSYCNIEGYNSSYVQHTINTEPHFIDPTNGTGSNFNALEANWDLQSNSVCINHGTPDTTGLNIPLLDLGGNPRIYQGNNTQIDIGAYEYQGEPDPVSDIMINPTGLNFGLQTVNTISSARDINIYSIGFIDLEISSIIAPPGFLIKRESEIEYVVSIEPFTIPLEEVEVINVVFNPQFSVDYNDDIIISSDDPDEIENYITLNGTGDIWPVYYGDIEEDTIWDADTVKISNNVTINDGVRVTITPGTFVQFLGGFRLNIQGQIIADGTYQDSIRFDYYKTPEGYWDGWCGIRFLNTPSTNDSSLFNYCVVKNTYNTSNGGGVYINNFSKIEFDNCLFTNCNGKRFGGAFLISNSAPNIFNTKIIRNNVWGLSQPQGYSTPGDGGGLYCCNGSFPKIINCEIKDNFAENGVFEGVIYSKGGGLFIYNSSILLMNSLVSGNINGSGSSSSISCWNSNVFIINCTITNNSNCGIAFDVDSNANIYNSIFFNPSSEFYIDENCECNVFYCDIDEGFVGFSGDGSGENYIGNYENNLDSDPLFIDPDIDNYHLLSNSPCINAGTPDTTGLNLPEYDLSGNPRIYDGRIDMGCYEWQGVAVDDLIYPTSIKTKLYANFPNPFNPSKAGRSPSTTISFSISEKDKNKPVTLNIYNIKGQKVKKLVSDQQLAGQHSQVWDGKDEFGKPVSSGIYFYQLQIDERPVATRKCLLLK